MPQKPMQTRKPHSMPPAVLLLIVPALMAGCATNPEPMPPLPVRNVQIPPLPQTSRQPPTPLICLPDCLTALMKERESWLQSLTMPAPEGLPAKPTTTAPAPH